MALCSLLTLQLHTVGVPTRNKRVFNQKWYGTMFHFQTMHTKLIVIQSFFRCVLACSRRTFKEQVDYYRIRIHKLQSAVRRRSCHRNFVIVKKGVKRLQAVCRREMLPFIVRNDKELKGKLLDVFVAIKRRMHCRCDASEAYNLALLSQFYEAVKKYYELRTSQRLHHQLFLINRKLNSYKEK